MLLSTQARITPGPKPRTDPILSYIDVSVVRRAAVVALVLGSVLTLFNQPTAVFGPGAIEVLPLVLVFVTPFLVVTASQALAARQAVRDGSRAGFQGPINETAVDTAMRHGIPARAALLGLIMGSINSIIVAGAILADGGTLDAMPAALLAQAFALPMLFGVLSQAITYRRVSRVLESR